MLIKKSLAGGIIIGLAGAIYFASPHKILGSLLFSLGLLSIFKTGAFLFTSKVATESPIDSTFILGLNALSAAIIGIIVSPLFQPIANQIVENKTAAPTYDIFIKSILCGILVYLASRIKEDLATILCVTSFVACGFEHSIANIFFFAVARKVDFIFIAICILGNVIGAVGMKYLVDFQENK